MPWLIFSGISMDMCIVAHVWESAVVGIHGTRESLRRDELVGWDGTEVV